MQLVEDRKPTIWFCYVDNNYSIKTDKGVLHIIKIGNRFQVVWNSTDSLFTCPLIQNLYYSKEAADKDCDIWLRDNDLFVPFKIISFKEQKRIGYPKNPSRTDIIFKNGE